MKKNKITVAILVCLLLSAWVSPVAAKKVEIKVQTGEYSDLWIGTPELAEAIKKVKAYNLQEGDEIVFIGSMNKADFDGIKDLIPFGGANYTPLKFKYIDISQLEITEYKDTNGKIHPANVIPEQAFLGYRNPLSDAEKYIIGNNIVGIGTRGFSGTTAEEIVLPTTSLKTIGAFAFQGISDLTSFTLPESVTVIENGAFDSFVWPGITVLTLPKGLKKLGGGAFSHTQLTEIILPDGVEEMGGSQTFSHSNNLTSFRFPDGVKRIVDVSLKGTEEGVLDNTFAWSQNLTSVTNLPGCITKLKGTFNGTKITQIDLPEGITEISDRAFPETLTSLKLPSTLTTLKRDAFAYLNHIETLELPANVTTIANGALKGMSNLKKLVVRNPNPDVLNYWSQDWGEDKPTKKESQNVFEGIVKEGDGACVLYVPAESVEAYRNARLWGEFKTIAAIGSDAKAQTIENFNDFTAFVGDEPITLSATSNAPNRAIIYEPEKGKESVATIEGNVLTIKGAGTVKITAKAEGDFEWLAAEKTVTLTVRDYSWLQAPALAVNGNSVSVVGPGKEAFTLITINGKEGADLTNVTGEVKITASTADGKQTIRLVINR
jgi:hypothetical protein